MRPFIPGTLLGLLLSALVVGGAMALFLPKKVRDARYGWEPKPALVLQRDVAVGEVLREEDLAEVSYPEQFVLESFVPPSERKAVLGRPVSQLLRKGDLLGWVAFADRAAPERIQACVASVRAAYSEAYALAREEALRGFTPPEDAGASAPSPVPSFQFDADGKAAVVVLARDVGEGSRLTKDVLEVRRMPRALVTRSLVPAGALEQVVGALAVVQMQAGDALRWQFLDDPSQPRSLGACLVQVSQAATRRCADVPRQRAEAFFAGSREGR
ncbi:hypothetical protein HPC49_03445 [Pyxidicoccus fallax]|uniref:SAF domain-containing protein n=1 Tax=Pyxidicoccus fallax TaxID=394095 RepID=A0A848LFG6_9BACT|nr:SAF domain-containing protein [Pyxidicoccus fallax]NMO15773.1 hypothetical protein [Pyxidicoccus fallax]NPC77311.1 hypothetical protein [Pyxidicoccus fallax]